MTEHIQVEHWELHHRDGRRLQLIADGCWLTVQWPDSSRSRVHLSAMDLPAAMPLVGEDPQAWDLVTEGWRLRMPDNGCNLVPVHGTGAIAIHDGGAIQSSGSWVLTPRGLLVKHREAGTVLWGWGIATIWTDDECGLSVIQGLPAGPVWADAGHE